MQFRPGPRGSGGKARRDAHPIGAGKVQDPGVDPFQKGPTDGLKCHLSEVSENLLSKYTPRTLLNLQ